MLGILWKPPRPGDLAVQLQEFLHLLRLQEADGICTQPQPFAHAVQHGAVEAIKEYLHKANHKSGLQKWKIWPNNDGFKRGFDTQFLAIRSEEVIIHHQLCPQIKNGDI